MSQHHRALNHSAHNESTDTKNTQVQACIHKHTVRGVIIYDSVFYSKQKRSKHVSFSQKWEKHMTWKGEGPRRGVVHTLCYNQGREKRTLHGNETRTPGTNRVPAVGGWLGIVIGQQSKDDFHPDHFSFSHTSSCSICVLPVHVAQAQVLLQQKDRSRLVWQVQDFSFPAKSRERIWLWRLK